MEMHLQDVGTVDAVQAQSLKAGDQVMFNFGIVRTVESIVEASPKFMSIAWSGVPGAFRVMKTKKMAKV